MKKKIAGHIGAISSMLVGTNFIYEAFNYRGGIYKLFNLEVYVNPAVLLDTGLLLMGLGFFIEFFLSFKPLEVKK